ncbi:MAG: DUF3857 domain-containing protein [Sphingobacteriales bacterium]|nr:DUF3857 domain-containing protein [Sphingobacteriales bacterium]
MKKVLNLFISIICSQFVFSQSATYIPEIWDEKPVYHKLDSKYANESGVTILDKRRIEYIDEKDGQSVYKTLHRIVQVHDDKGIEMFNRIYLGVSDNSDIVEIKARTMTPSGKIKELDRSNIKDLKESDGNVYKIFAVEGLEKGSEIEYYYTYKRAAYYFGREIIQSNTPSLDASVQIVAPARLVFESKTYNTTAKPADTTIDEKRFTTIQLTNLPSIPDNEKYANVRANIQRVEFKLAYNLSRSATERVFTWNELAKRIYDIYTTTSEKENIKVESFAKDNNWDKLSSAKEKIIAVENFIKKNFAPREDIDAEDAENLEKIIKNKVTSFGGMVRLYAAIFKYLGVEYQFVLTGDRNDFTIDKNFEFWNTAENHLFYFPSLKKFMAPTRIETRFPWIYYNWGNTNGLFCKGTTIGSFTTAIGEIKPVPLEDYTSTVSNIEANVSINPSADTAIIDIKQIHSGYEASVFKASFTYGSEEDQKNFIKELVKFGTNSEHVVSSKLENTDFESYSENKPFILNASVRASELIERAGNKILVKIGDIIGPQVEMYQDKPRQLPIEIEFPHLLERKINFIIPDGYRVKNLDDIKLNNTYKENGELTMGFVSDYTIEGNTVKIHVMEEYRKVAYPISQYEEFKKIINTAADFNKIVLVLEKIQ